MKIKDLLLLGWIAVLTGCADYTDELSVNNELQEGMKIQISGNIEQQYLSRANDGGFCGGDQIGLYGVNYTNNNTVAGTLLDKGNQVDNVRYTYDEESMKWTSSTTAYYKDVNTCIDLYGYYPYASPSSVSEYEFEVATDQNNNGGYAASDFLWAKAEKVKPSENRVGMRFAHKLACANVVLTAGKGFEKGEFDKLQKSVLVLNTTHTATINLATGQATAVGKAAKDGILMMQGSDGFRAIVVPQTVAAGKKLFAITLDGITYYFSKETSFTYEAGMQSKFTLTVDKKNTTGQYEFTLTDSEIVPWIADLETHGGEARQYYVVNQEEPGTLGALIRADQKNPDKIKNLKISGKINASDFYFMRDSMEILQAVNLKECTIVASTKVSYTIDGQLYYTYLNGIITDKNEAKTILNEIVPNAKFSSLLDKFYENEIPNEAFYHKSSLINFSFPEKVTKINKSSFSTTMLSGALVIPDDVEEIGDYAFIKTNISSLALSQKLKKIGVSAFDECSFLSGTLSLPESLEIIGSRAFYGCVMLSGTLVIPSKIKEISSLCFHRCGFTGDLILPEGLEEIGLQAFYDCSKLTGKLVLPNTLKIMAESSFSGCKFQGELFIPNLVMVIPKSCFSGNCFSSITFAEDSEIIKIEGGAFNSIRRLTEAIILPKKLMYLGSSAFASCVNLPKIILPESTETIAGSAFSGCYGITAITCKAVLPPVVGDGAFDGVAKDNFTLEVPEQSVASYQTAKGWSDFRRSISAHHDFSISRPLLRTLNETYSKTYILRAPSGQAWSIKKKPEWVTVTPASGVGKAEVTVTVNQMPATTDKFEYTYRNESGKIKTETHVGRADSIIFLLDDKNYTTGMRIEQYQSDRYDGEVITHQKATVGKGVNVVFMGDCFDAKDIATGKYVEGIEEAIDYYFAIEPYKTYKEYFNIYTVMGMSPDTGMGTVNTVKEAKFGSQYSLDGISPNQTITYEYAMKAATVDENNLHQTLVVMVENTTEYGGICYMYGDGSAIAVCPMSRDAYPYDFRGIVQHEAGGHGFAKLADEYIYTNAFIASCECPNKHLDDFNAGKKRGWYRNLSTNGDMNTVEWAHLIYHPDYSGVVDMYEGGYFHTRGIYRSEATSCMNNNIDYYSAIQRQEMVERIMKYAGLEFSLDEFYANDVRDAKNNVISRMAEPSAAERTSARKQMAPRMMGDKPKLK